MTDEKETPMIIDLIDAILNGFLFGIGLLCAVIVFKFFGLTL